MSLVNIINEFIVTDVSKSVKIYEENLGFSTVATDGNPITWAQLENGKMTIMFNSYDDVKASISGYPAKTNSSNLIMFEYDNPDEIKQIYNTLKAKNLEFFNDYTETDYGKIEFGIYDLDKNMILFSGPAR